MTNYRIWIAAAAVLLAGACHAADTPAAAATSAARWTQSQGSLTFTFDQAGAASKGTFKQFSTDLVYDEKSPSAGSLSVKVQIASIDTQDQERNDMLVGADLFDAKKFPTAQYVASSFARTASGSLEAVGKLTLRGVTKDLRLPLKIVPTADGLELSGTTSIKRLDYGVGQGDWQSTEGVADEVKIQYKVILTKAK